MAIRDPEQTYLYELTATQLTNTHASLLMLLNQVQTGHQPVMPWSGICGNWARGIGDHFPLVPCGNPYMATLLLSKNWKGNKYPGLAVSYPIKENHQFAPWKGPNLTARIDFMRYMLKRLRDLKRRALKREEKNFSLAGVSAEIVGRRPTLVIVDDVED